MIPDNLGKVQDLIIGAQTKWINLGLGLHIKMSRLEVIEQDRHDVGSRFREMLLTWLKMVDPSPSWEGLIAALEMESVGCDDVAEVVRQMLGVMKPIPESGQLFPCTECTMYPWCYGNFHAVDLIPDNLPPLKKTLDYQTLLDTIMQMVRYSTVDPRISEPHSSEAPDYPNPEK